MSTAAPVSLLLDSGAAARLNEHGLLPWWLHNVSGDEVVEASVHVRVVGNLQDFVIFETEQDRHPLASEQVRRISTPFRALTAGRFALRVRLALRLRHGGHSEWKCPNEVEVTVSHPDAQGRVSMTFSEPSVIKGYLPPGDYRFEAPVVVKPGDSARGPEATPSTLGLAATLPKAENCLSLPLTRVEVPGLGPELSLSDFAEHWQQLRRPHLASLMFIDEHGRHRTQPAKVKQPYRLHVHSFRGGHLTLLTRGASGRHFQLAPHTHFGDQVVKPGGVLVWPDQVFTNAAEKSTSAQPDPALVMNGSSFLSKGREEVIAIVSPKPIAMALAIYVRTGQPPAQIEPDYVREVLRIALDSLETELAHTALTVLP